MREIIRDIKVRRVSTIATLAGGVLLIVAGGWSAMQWLSAPSSTSQGNTLPEVGLSMPKEVTQPTAVSTLSVQPQPAIAPKNLTAAKTDPTAIAAVQGLLRVGNPTDHPVRVALLKKIDAKGSGDRSQTGYEPPAHWDFDPGEGSEKGLLLSLPNRQIKLKKGDVLVAFAQDGSRRYWGPYVVGETSIPAWTSKTAEWRLTLQP